MSAPAPSSRLAILDGWRAASILLVMASHFLPLNALLPGLNNAAGASGMAIFFTLSGFLITRFLLDRPQVAPFLIRRILRILPLAWAAMLAIWLLIDPARDPSRLAANLLFYANLPPNRQMHGGDHLWSLCVEAQFYLGVAALVGLGGRRGLLALPLIGLAVTAARIAAGETISIVTWHRLDEILAGATIALIWSGELGEAARRWLPRLGFWLPAALAAATCFWLESPITYLRPWAVAAMVGVTLWHAPRWLEAVFVSRPARYVAEVSYALYVFHGMLVVTWLGSGDTLVKYAKRPLLIGATFVLAHLSTFHFEKRFIDLAKRLTTRTKAQTTA